MLNFVLNELITTIKIGNRNSAASNTRKPKRPYVRKNVKKEGEKTVKNTEKKELTKTTTKQLTKTPRKTKAMVEKRETRSIAKVNNNNSMTKMPEKRNKSI